MAAKRAPEGPLRRATAPFNCQQTKAEYELGTIPQRPGPDALSGRAAAAEARAHETIGPRGVAGQPVRVQVVTDLAVLREEWTALAERIERSSVFARYEWFDAAWQWRRDEAQLHIITVRSGADLIGIWPLVREHEAYCGVPLRMLRFLTVPDTQWCDVIARDAEHETVCAALVDHLRDTRSDWDRLQLDKLPADSPTLARLSEGLAAGGHAVACREAATNPVIALDGTFEAHYARRSRRLKKGNNLVANKLARAHEAIEVRWHHGRRLDRAELQALLEAAISISASSWKSETGLTLDNPGPGAFIRRLSEHANEQGWLSLWTLELDGTPVATEYQLAFAGTVHALRADFDDSYDELSPGTYLNWKLLEQLFASDLERYEMGPGNNRYKMRWTDTAASVQQLEAYGKSMRGRLLAFVTRRLRPALASARSRLRRDRSG